MAKLIVGKNDLATTHPDIAAQWHQTKNEQLTAKDVTANSHKKVCWAGTCGHDWIAPVADRTRGRGCPICKSKKVVPGLNDLATTHPHIAAQWHQELNKIPSTAVLPKSNKPAWWICEKGHTFEMPPSHRTTRDSACPICSNKKVLVGYNDLATTHPDIAAQWDNSKNELTPQQVTIGAEKMVWWVCEKGHEWEALVYSRKKNGCPYCAGNKVWVGFNDLATTHPALAAEWHKIKNGELTARDVTAGSNLKAWWSGSSCGHVWESVISSRKSGCGCPVCAAARKRSFPEAAVFLYVSRIFPDTISPAMFPWLGNKSLDIYIPSIQTAIEYDGQAWHQGKGRLDRDEEKNKLCKENGVRLIRIREPDCPAISGECILLHSCDLKDLDIAIESLLYDYLHHESSVDVDSSRDEAMILECN